MIRAIRRTYREAYEGLPREVWLLSIVLFVNRSGTMVLPFLTLYLTFERGYSTESAGALIGVYGIGSILGSFAGGWLASRIGAVRTQVLSLTLSCPAFLLLLFTKQWWELAAALFTVSLIADMVRPASATATANYCPRHLHKKAFGLNRLSVNLGMTFGPAVGGFVYELNINLLFIIDALTCLAAAVALLVLFPLNKVEREPNTDEENEFTRGRAPWRDMQFLTFLSLLGMFAIIFFQLLSTYPLFLKQHYRFSESTIGLVLAVNTVVIVAVEMILLHRLRSMPDLRAVGIGGLFVCLGFGIIPMGSGVAFCILSVLIWTVGEMLSMPMSLAYVSRRASVKYRGMYLGMFTMVYSIAFVIAPLIGTRLYALDHSLPFYAILACGIPLCAIFFCLSKWDQADQKKESDHVSLKRSADRLRVEPLPQDTPV